MILEYPKEKLERLKARYSSLIEEVVTEDTDRPILFVKKANIIEFLDSIRREEGFEYNFLSDLTACDDNPPVDKITDYGLGFVAPERAGEPRFHVIYNLLSMQNKDRIRVKVRVAEGDSCPTATGIWRAAEWLEREVYDMYGIGFDGHPDLRRIMMSDTWVGHPQRKDYPIKQYQRTMYQQKLEDSGLKEF